MTFSIIGTGNTAWFFATRLAAAGHSCKAIYGRDGTKVKLLTDKVNSTGYLLERGVKDDTDVCIIAVSDHAIREIAATLLLKKTVLLHTAGAVSIRELEEAATHYGVIWPVYSIIKTNLPEAKNIPTVWEASDTVASECINSILQSITDTGIQASSAQRKWLHLSAVFSNNFTNHLFSIAEQICREQSLPFDLLYPIIEQSIKRVKDSSPFDQQSGPAKRGDTITMQQQIDMLQQHAAWQRIYEAVSVSIRDMYKENNDLS